MELKIGKIVGGPNKHTWSQTHVFSPEKKSKRKKFGHLLSSFSLKAKEERLDIASFGKEIIARFHEIYYSSKQKKIFNKLKTSLQSLKKEFLEQIEMEVAAGVVGFFKQKPVGFFVCLNQGQSYLFREGKLTRLFQEKKEINSCSGFLQDQDIIVLATDQFSQIVSQEVLKKALTNRTVGQIIEFLAPVVQSSKTNQQTAAVVFKIKLASGLKEPVLKKPEPAGQQKAAVLTAEKSLSFKTWLKKIKLIFKVFFKSLQELKKEKSFYIQDQQKKKKAKKTTLTVALILIFLLVLSVVLGVRKRSASKQTKVVKELKEKVDYKYQQALSLSELNPLRARSLLKEAKEMVDDSIDQIDNQEDKKEIVELAQLVDQALEKVAREYKVEKGEVFLDLGLAREDFKGSQWQVDEGSLFILDQQKKTVLKVEAESKSTEVVAGGEKLADSQLIGVTNNRLFVLTSAKLLVIDIEKGELVDQKEIDNGEGLVDLVGFLTNAYLLDKQNNQIWKYRGIDGGLGSKSGFLTVEADLSQSASLAIDGAVWLLFSDGRISKFVRGKKDHFVVSGLDKPLAEGAKIYTDPSLDNLYILDRKNTRVAVISKETGEYQAQYFWPGIAGIVDLAVFKEQKLILLLSGERIYQLEIRE